MTRNLNNIIDYNYYPTPETKTSNMRHRPIGLGVQGLANVFMELKIAFTSEEAKQLNSDIFETIYYASMEASMELAKERDVLLKESIDDTFTLGETLTDLEQKGPSNTRRINTKSHLGSYSSFVGSPLHKGHYQFDLWNHTPSL